MEGSDLSPNESSDQSALCIILHLLIERRILLREFTHPLPLFGDVGIDDLQGIPEGRRSGGELIIQSVFHEIFCDPRLRESIQLRIEQEFLPFRFFPFRVEMPSRIIFHGLLDDIYTLEPLRMLFSHTLCNSFHRLRRVEELHVILDLEDVAFSIDHIDPEHTRFIVDGPPCHRREFPSTVHLNVVIASADQSSAEPLEFIIPKVVAMHLTIVGSPLERRQEIIHCMITLEESDIIH